ncbi:MAG: hypothetical protein H3C27_06355 [Opitutaceae bacterium]|nr:hypothetical protein [Opitutaceae bacterium]
MKIAVTSRDLYSLKKDLLQSFWFVVAGAVTVYSHVLLEKSAEGGPVLKWLLALSPFAPLFLYVRTVLRAIRAMDELQRRIQMEAWLFAAIGTLFATTAVNVLHENRLLTMLFQPGLGLPGTAVVMFLLLLLGGFMANRRYQ